MGVSESIIKMIIESCDKCFTNICDDDCDCDCHACCLDSHCTNSPKKKNHEIENTEDKT